MRARRHTILGLALALGLLAARPARAEEVFLPLQPITLEMWDARGLFHMVDLQLTVAFPAQSKLNKASSIKIQEALQTLPYEELTKPSGTATIKSTAFDIVRALPGGETAEDVLIQKLMFR